MSLFGLLYKKDESMLWVKKGVGLGLILSVAALQEKNASPIN